MSYTELRIVKLTPFKHVKSPQEFINFARENKLDVSIYPGVEEYFDEYYITHIVDYSSDIAVGTSGRFNVQYEYVFYKNVIYKFDDYITEDEEGYINRFIINSDGSIDLVSMFYNCGTDFAKNLRGGLNALLNEENKDEYR